MKPELDNGSVVELVNLAAHGDEAVAVLNLLHVFFPGRLGADLAEHRLGGGWAVGGVRRREVGNGDKAVGGGTGEKKKKGAKHERALALRLSSKCQRSRERQAQAMSSFQHVRCVCEAERRGGGAFTQHDADTDTHGLCLGRHL